MNKLAIFNDEIITQCKFALMSWEYLPTRLPELPQNEEEKTRIFYHIQAFLTAVANISKILWPSPNPFDKIRRKELIKLAKSRGEELRKLLCVPENSPIKYRNFRNDFEHYDERIDVWAISSQKKNILDMNISIEGFSAIPHQDPIDSMRNLDFSRDCKKLTLTFNKKRYNLNEIKDLVTELQEKATKLRPSLYLSL